MDLIKFEAAKSALAACRSVDEVLALGSKTAALQAYGRIAKDKGLEVDAAEIRIRAERRLGELLAAQKAGPGLAKPGPKKIGSESEPNSQPPAVTLEEAGIDKKLSARAQKIAKVPEAEFEAELDGWRGRVEQEGARVSARLEAAGAKADPEAPTDFDAAAEHAADYEALVRIIDEDDRLKAAVEELRKARALHAATEALYLSARIEVKTLKSEAARWMRKAKKSAACQECMTALERE